MPFFIYRARDAQGRDSRGSRDAATADALVAQLRGEGLLVLSISGLAETESARPPLRLRLPSRGPSRLDVELGMQQLSAMLHSGLTLLSALRTVAEQSGRRRVAALWDDLRDRIERGEPLSDAMHAHPSAFPPYVVQLIRVGEQSGELDRMFTRAAEHLEQTRTLRLMVVNALAYPALVALMAVGVAGFMVLDVIPKVGQFLAGRGRSLPRMTQALLDFADWMRAYLPGIGVTLLASVAVLWALNRWPPGRGVLHGLVLRLPPVGSILRLSGTAVAARGLGILLESGVSLLDALRTVERLVGNLAQSRRLAAARTAVMGGERLSDALLAGKEYLPMLSRMVAVGETTGTLGRALSEAARFHEARLVATIRRFSVVIEPVMIAVVGGIVGFVYVAFFVALFSIASSVR